MKNFLITVLALGLVGSAYLTRPDREEFERYLAAHEKSALETKRETKRESGKGGGIDRNLKEVDVAKVLGDIEFKDCYLWTVVRRDGKTLYTGVFDRWIDNEKVKGVFPS